MANEEKILTPETEERPSQREVLEASWDHLEKWEQEGGTPGESPAPAEAPPAAPGPAVEALAERKRVRDATTGRFTPGPQEKGPAAAAPPPAGPQVPPAGVQPPPPAAVPASRPPQSLRPVAREQWVNTPPAIQQEFLRREREVQSALQQTAQARQFADEWTKVLQPHAQFIQSTGVPPAQLISNLFNTARNLAGQDDNGRAAILANIMRAYRVPVEALARAIDAGGAMPSGGMPPQQMAPQQPMLDPRVDQLQAELRQWREQITQEQNAYADQRLDVFLQENPAAANYLDEMADLMTVSGQRGVDMDYPHAYSIILQAMAPDVAAAQRQGQDSTEPPNPGDAALSVRPEAGQRPSSPPKTTREALEAAWDKHSGGGRV